LPIDQGVGLEQAGVVEQGEGRCGHGFKVVSEYPASGRPVKM
jgi:hypothetical protein